MKLYTKTGDSGTTSLIGERRNKSDMRVDSYGKIDSLNSYLNIVISYQPQYNDDLIRISKYLFNVGYDLSNTANDSFKTTLDEITWLETRIDFYQNEIGEFNYFVLPGGTIIASHLHYIRTLVRECERITTALSQKEPINELVLQYLNRLSDLIYIIACYENKLNDTKLIPITF